MSVMIQRCRRCAAHWFPDRLVCRKCGGTSFDRTEARQCRIEQMTTLADGRVIAAARFGDEVPLVVGLIGHVAVGDMVPLTASPVNDGPAAYLPIRTEPNEADE